eukprot:11151056-Alexandrium_andersonii.AAC.1
MIPTDSPMCVGAVSARKSYGERTRGKKGHSEGPPDAHVWKSLLSEAIKMASDKPPGNVAVARALTVLKEHYSSSDLASVQQNVKSCTITKAFSSAQKRLEISFGPEVKLIGDAFAVVLAECEVATELIGAAPRGGIERELSQLVEGLSEAS